MLSRHLFGQFAEHLGKGIYEGIWVGPDSPIPNTRGIRNDVVAALKALKVPNVRWPGGCFADEYHWRKGIGPLNARPATLNPNWGGVIEPNTFGTHEFLDFIEQIGSEAYLSINLGSGTPQEAAEWLEYLTAAQPTALAKERAANGHAAPYKIAYPRHRQRELGLRRQHVRRLLPEPAARPQPLRAQLQSRRSRRAIAMLKIAVGPGGGGPRFAAWTETIMKSWKGRQWSWDHMDGLSLHNYTVVRFPGRLQVGGLRRDGLRRDPAGHR